ncbi:MAG: rRNA maturation RNase YbeY [Xanthobacteraceae bacterium]
MLRIGVVVASARWKSAGNAGALVRRAIAAAAKSVAHRDGEVAVVLTDDAGIRKLNRDWRRKDVATNVLAFPAGPLSIVRGAPRLLGDIVIAYETTLREASTGHMPLDHHLAHLAVHGFLHLLGYDHGSDEEADRMESLERTILAGLDVPDPYRPQARRS